MAAIHFPLNSKGRDFVVGDIHGYFSLLEQLLEQVNFDPASDRLFSVGDLIDRGPESELSLTYLKKDWFNAVRGNHEELLIAAQNQTRGVFDLWMRVGGFWAQQVEPEILQEMADAFFQLPYLIQVETHRGLIGITHADVPEPCDWKALFESVRSGQTDNHTRKTLTWSRDRFRRCQQASQYPGSYVSNPVTNVEQVYVGHSIVREIVEYEKVTFIDTGPFCGGSLTMIDLNENRQYSIDSNT